MRIASMALRHKLLPLVDGVFRQSSVHAPFNDLRLKLLRASERLAAINLGKHPISSAKPN